MQQQFQQSKTSPASERCWWLSKNIYNLPNSLSLLTGCIVWSFCFSNQDLHFSEETAQLLTPLRLCNSFLHFKVKTKKMPNFPAALGQLSVWPHGYCSDFNIPLLQPGWEYTCCAPGLCGMDKCIHWDSWLCPPVLRVTSPRAAMCVLLASDTNNNT